MSEVKKRKNSKGKSSLGDDESVKKEISGDLSVKKKDKKKDKGGVVQDGKSDGDVASTAR